MGFKLEVVRVKGGCRWAIKATMNGEVRYRGYHYKAEAVKNMETWVDCDNWYFPREFYHDFNTAKELQIKAVKLSGTGYYYREDEA